MRRSNLLIAVHCLLVALLLLPGATSPVPSDGPATPAATASGSAPSVETRFAAAVQQSREAFNAELARLTELFAASATPEEALAVQRQITLLKQNAEIGVLEIQLGFAREAGRAEQAAELEGIIAQARAVLEGEPAGAGR